MNEYASLSNSVLKEADKRFMEHMNRLCKKPGKFLLRIEELVKVTGLPAVYLWTFVSDRHKFTTFNCLMVRSFELHPETIVLEIEVV